MSCALTRGSPGHVHIDTTPEPCRWCPKTIDTSGIAAYKSDPNTIAALPGIFLSTELVKGRLKWSGKNKEWKMKRIR